MEAFLVSTGIVSLAEMGDKTQLLALLLAARFRKPRPTQALGVDGTISTRTAGLQKLIAKNGEDQTALLTRVDNFQARLVAQYTALDSNVAKLNSLSSYVTQQIANWNKSTA